VTLPSEVKSSSATTAPTLSTSATTHEPRVRHGWRAHARAMCSVEKATTAGDYPATQALMRSAQVTTCNLGRRVICRRHRATGVELYVRLTPIDIRPTKPVPLFASLSIDLLPPLRKIESVAFRVARAPRLEYGDRL
jgi:hypothetical protein